MNSSDLETIKKLDLKAPYVWAATWFGFGFFRPAPGTWGALASIPPALLVFSFLGLYGVIGGIIIITVIGFWASDKFDRATGGHDNKMIVIDEAAGQWITLLPALYLTGVAPFPVLLSFILFRFFDILKPWPVSWFDKTLTGPISVMGDDIVAGIMGALILTGIIHYAGLG